MDLKNLKFSEEEKLSLTAMRERSPENYDSVLETLRVESDNFSKSATVLYGGMIYEYDPKYNDLVVTTEDGLVTEFFQVSVEPDEKEEDTARSYVLNKNIYASEYLWNKAQSELFREIAKRAEDNLIEGINLSSGEDGGYEAVITYSTVIAYS